jgi:hypothetical protein
VNKVVMILSAVLVASGGGTLHAQEAAAASPAQAPPANPEKPVDTAMLALPGALTPESLAALTRGASDGAAASRELSRQLAASPEVQERLRVRFRTELPNQHPDIEEKVGLSSKEADRLFDLLGRQNDTARREAAAATATRTRAERIKAEEAEQATLLGNKYPKWRDYKAALPLRLQVKSLGDSLNADDIPLSDAKVEPLIAALVAAQKQIGPGGTPPTAESDRILLDAAAPFLSAPQLEVYRKILGRQPNRARSVPPPDLISPPGGAMVPPGE